MTQSPWIFIFSSVKLGGMSLKYPYNLELLEGQDKFSTSFPKKNQIVPTIWLSNEIQDKYWEEFVFRKLW